VNKQMKMAPARGDSARCKGSSQQM
jgi:hypothetical protein